MREYKRKFKEFSKLKSLRTNMEKIRLISSQVIRREKLKLRICSTEQENFESNAESIKTFLKQSPLPKGRPPQNKKLKMLKLMKKSISKRVYPQTKRKYLRRNHIVKNNIDHEDFNDYEDNNEELNSYQLNNSIKANNISEKPKELVSLMKAERKIIKKTLKFKIKEKNKAKKNKLLKMIRKTTNSIIPSLNLKKNAENPNEPSDNLEEKERKSIKTLKCEIKGLVRTQNTKELALFIEISKKSAINRKILRSRNLKGKLRSNKMYRYNY